MVSDVLLTDLVEIMILFYMIRQLPERAHVHLWASIWRLDPATNSYGSAAEFLLFHCPVEWALQGYFVHTVTHIFLFFLYSIGMVKF